MILEKTASKNKAPDGGPETDLNDQIAVGSYQSKNFEMSNPAQKLYSDLPADTSSDAAEQAAIHLDKLFHIDKDTHIKGYSSTQDITTAKELAAKIKAMAKQMNLEAEHEKIIKTSLDRIQSHPADNDTPIDPDKFVSPEDAPQYKTPSKDYTTDRTSDRDIDNVKKFLIRRSLAAQRKLKIIDD